MGFKQSTNDGTREKYRCTKRIKEEMSNHNKDNYSINNICCILGIKKSLAYKILSLHAKYGTVTDPYKYSHLLGCHQVFSSADISFIFAIVQHHSTIYLYKIQHKILMKYQKFVMLPTLLQTLQHFHITQKVISALAAEQNKEMWTIYMNCIIADILDPNMLIFIDEAAKNKWMSAHLYGQSMKSVCYLVQRYFVCGARYFIISAITLNGIIAYDIIKGPADGQHFLKFLEEHVASLDQFPYIILTFCWYRCPSRTHILVLIVSLSWTTAGAVHVLIEYMHCMLLKALFFIH